MKRKTSQFAALVHLLPVFLVLAGLASCAVRLAGVAEPSSMPVQGPLRPPVMGRNAGVSAGHPLTTAAALEILQQGGNAFDAGVAALLVGGTVEQIGRAHV